MAQWSREQEAADQRAAARTSAAVSRVARAIRLNKLADKERRNAAQSNVVARYMETGRCPFGHRNCTSTEHGDGLAYVPTSDVTVHHTRGCELCGRRDEHSHTHSDWWALIDSVGDRSGDQLDPPPAAEPYQSPDLHLNLPHAPSDGNKPDNAPREQA